MHDVWVGIASVVFAVLAAWASRRVLGTRIGWLRAIVTGIVIFLATVPLARSALISADVLRGQGLAIDSPTAALFVALALGLAVRDRRDGDPRARAALALGPGVPPRPRRARSTPPT